MVSNVYNGMYSVPTHKGELPKEAFQKTASTTSPDNEPKAQPLESIDARYEKLWAKECAWQRDVGRLGNVDPIPRSERQVMDPLPALPDESTFAEYISEYMRKLSI